MDGQHSLIPFVIFRLWCLMLFYSWQQRLVFSEIERGTNNWEPAAGEVLHLVQSHVSVKLHAAHRHQPEQQVLQRPGQENNDTKEEETDREGNSRSSICQIIKWTFQVGLKTTSIRWRSWSSVWTTSAACVQSRASRSRSISTWWTVWSGSSGRQRQWRAGTGSPCWPRNTSSLNTSPVSLRIPFRSEYKAALTNEF